MTTTINYYLTPVSPWAYLGAKRFRKIIEDRQTTRDIAVNVKVVDYGTIFPKTGGLPLPKRSPERRAYRMMDLKRFRDYLNIPLVLEPDHFPSKTRLTAYSIIAAVKTLGDHAGMVAAESVLTGLWAENLNMDDPDRVVDVLTKAGLDGAALVAEGQAHQADYDQIITNDTEQALQDGVFGAPSYVISTGQDREVFWGQDRLDLLAWRLDKKI